MKWIPSHWHDGNRVFGSQREGRVEVGIMTARTQALDERLQESVSTHPFTDPCLKCFFFPPIPPLFFPIIQLFPRHDRRTHGHNQPPLKPNGEDHTETYYLYHIYLLSRGLISLFVWKEPHTLFFWRGWALTTALRLLKSMFCWKLDVDIN